MNPLLQTFVNESRELLEVVGSALLALESSPDDAEVVNEIFRAVHTIKGASGLFTILPLTQVVHVAEDILDKVRDRQIELRSDDIDLLLDSLDQVGRWLDELEATGDLGVDAPAIGAELSARLRSITAADPTPAAPAAADHNPADPTAADPTPTGHGVVWLHRVPDHVRSTLGAGQPVLAIVYEPANGSFFEGHDPLHIVRTMPGVAWFDVEAREAWPSIETFDPYRCVLRFHALSTAGRSELEDHLRYVLDDVVLAELPSGAHRWGPDEHTVTWAPTELTPDMVELLSTQLDILTLPWDPEVSPGQLTSVAVVVSRIAAAAGVSDATVAGARERALATTDPEPLRHLIAAALDDCSHPRSLDDPTDADFTDADFTDADLGLEPTPDHTPGSNDRSEQEPNDAGPTGDTRSRGRVLKVEQSRIDHLMDLVGELVVAKNALPFLARRAEDVFSSRELSREIKGQYAVINRLSEDLQYAVMQVRMVPVGSAFQRFPRLVRDLSRKLNKQVVLELRGEDTEADKNIVEDLADPLIHLVRNSLDHGIETPEQRRASGKSPEARLVLSAAQNDDQVVIEVSDDGAGIDPSAIKRKAYEKGLLSEDRLDSISDTDAMQLIFAPGFSTAEAVSDLSGRGVGMDVVRSTILRAGGTVSVHSELGVGTTIRLSLPLSMAVTKVMMIRVGHEDFGVPFKAVRQTVRVPRQRLRRINHREALVLRDQLIPLYRLDRILAGADGGMPSTGEVGEAIELDDDGDVAVLITEVRGHEVGLVVDDFQEAVDIILKPLEGVMSGFPLYSGTALLGDGRVLLVLHLKELVDACHIPEDRGQVGRRMHRRRSGDAAPVAPRQPEREDKHEALHPSP